MYDEDLLKKKALEKSIAVISNIGQGFIPKPSIFCEIQIICCLDRIYKLYYNLNLKQKEKIEELYNALIL